MTSLFYGLKVKPVLILLILVLLIFLPSAVLAENCLEPDTAEYPDEPVNHEDENCSQESIYTDDDSPSTYTSPETQDPVDSDPFEVEPPDPNSQDQDVDDPDISACTSSQDSLEPSSELPETEECLLSTCASSFDDSDQGVDSGEDYNSESTAASGNSYTATISPDAVVNGGTIPDGYDGLQAGDPGQFTVTFTEHSDSTKLGSAKVEIPDGFTDVSFNNDWSSSGIETSGDQEWEGKLEGNITDGYIIYLRALNPSSYLGKDEWVSVMFGAIAPSANGAYVFETAAWKDHSIADSSELDSESVPINRNNMAIGYRNPVVIVGTGIGSVEDLEKIGTDSGYPLSGHYVQTADIDFKSKYSEIADWNSGAGWEPIGAIDYDQNVSAFTGSYNGNGYTISNLYIYRPDESYVGLFSYTFSDAGNIFISHVTLSNVDITGGNNTGGLVAITNSSAYLFNCHVDGKVTSGSNVVGGLVGMNSGVITGSSFSGSVNGADCVGGLVGQQNSGHTIGCHTAGQVKGTGKVGGLIGMNYGTVENCHSSVTVEGDHTVGGLVGYNAYPSGSISNSYSTGSVYGTNEVGGLAGINSGSIANCSSSAVVTGIDGADENNNAIFSSFTGGLVGYQNEGSVTESYATGSVSGYWYVGGFVGSSSSNAEINNCYATGPVTGYWHVGGFVGINSTSSDISYCHATGLVTGIVGGSSGNHIGGFAGTNTGTITGCYSEGAATGNQSIGGFAGSNGGTVAASYASGAASGIYGVGGLIGYAQSGLVIDSYATGNVISKMAAGGLVGSNQGTLTRCYAIGDVEVVGETGNANSGKTAGGLVGQSNISGNINNCFSTGKVTGPADGEYLGSLVGYNSGAVTNCFAAGLVKGETAPLLGFDEGTLANVAAIDLAELRNIVTYQAGSATGWDWSITTTETRIARGDLNPYPYPLLSWEDEGFSGSYTWSINSEESNGGSNGGDDNGDGSGDETGNDLDDFDWSSGIPTEQTWSGGNTPAWARILLFRGRSGPQSVFSATAIISGSSSDLLKAVTAYNYALQNFEENKNSMTEAEYAVAVIELAVARAAILVMEARLSGGAAALAEAIEAYAFALAQLSNYGSFLDSSQGDVVSSLMNAIESTISALGG